MSSRQTVGSGGEREDNQLIAAAQTGDRLAFGHLYDRHVDSIYRYAFRLTGNRHDAEDLVADAFLTAWRKRNRFEPSTGSVRPWLFGITHNLARNRWRRQGRYRQAVARLPLRSVEEDVAASTAARVDDANLLSDLQAAVEKLPARERQVFELVVVAELTYAETAAALGIPIGTVRSRLAKARSRLRRVDNKS